MWYAVWMINGETKIIWVSFLPELSPFDSNSVSNGSKYSFRFSFSSLWGFCLLFRHERLPESESFYNLRILSYLGKGQEKYIMWDKKWMVSLLFILKKAVVIKQWRNLIGLRLKKILAILIWKKKAALDFPKKKKKLDWASLEKNSSDFNLKKKKKFYWASLEKNSSERF